MFLFVIEHEIEHLLHDLDHSEHVLAQNAHQQSHDVTGDRRHSNLHPNLLALDTEKNFKNVKRDPYLQLGEKMVGNDDTLTDIERIQFDASGNVKDKGGRNYHYELSKFLGNEENLLGNSEDFVKYRHSTNQMDNGYSRSLQSAIKKSDQNRPNVTIQRQKVNYQTKDTIHNPGIKRFNYFKEVVV